MILICLLAAFSISVVSSCQMDPSAWPEQNTVLDLAYCTNHASPGECVVADAGDDFSAFTNTVITLDSSGSAVPFSPENLMYTWSQIDNGSPAVILDDIHQQNPSFVATVAGLYVFNVTAEWFCRTDSDQVTVTLSPFTPSEVNAELITNRSNDTAVQVTYSSSEDSRLFIVYKSGRIMIIENGIELPTPFLDITPFMSTGFEQGLLGLAFDPDYANNHSFYVYYTGQTLSGTGSNMDTRIVAFLRDPSDPNLADPNANSLLLSIEQPESNHNGGQLLFGPDGYLYIGTGDGGGAGDAHGSIGNGQDPFTLLGKMLRIQVDGLNPYSIPADNPFVGSPGILDEIWALGLRNPWRFSFDRISGDLYIADVGQNLWEEINVQPQSSTGGENYGWRLKEGFACFNPSSGCDPGGLTDPVHVYSHAGNCSISGGFVYRGQDVTGLSGFYVYGDWCSSRYWILINRGSGWENHDLSVFVDGNLLSENITAFGEDNMGELYICTSANGANIYKLSGLRTD